MALLSAGFVYAGISGSYQNLGRFLTISPGSSTFLGRILYWKDGLRMLGKYPLGSGYMGYSYLQTSMQTGVYATRFVHNDFLQIFLDAGIVPGILFVLAVGKEIFSKRTEGFQRWMLIIMGLHFLVDFDLQYLGIFFLFLLQFSWEHGKEIPIRKNIIPIGIMGIAAALFLYFGTACFLAYMDCDEAALAMYSCQTEILVRRLEESEDMECARELADAILEQNKNIALVYDAKALLAALKNDYDSMIEYKELALTHGKYDLFEYVDYLNLLKRSLTYYEQIHDAKKYEKSRKIMKDTPNRLETVREQTDSLAWKIRDKPQLELSSEILKYLESL